MGLFSKNEKEATKIGLVLPGGGARAAYQVGVLKAIAKLHPKDAPSPFKVITGTSAGSINAAALSMHADNFRLAVYRVNRIWHNFECEHVFEADAISTAKNGFRWVLASLLGGIGRYNPSSFLNRTPLKKLLKDKIDFNRVQRSIDSGHLHALGVTASGYDSGLSVTFFQGNSDITKWKRERRVGRPALIQIDHLMASSAIPLVFSATKIDKEFFGDGSMRQMAPISPALHLGANKVLVVGIKNKDDDEGEKTGFVQYPSLAQIVGHVLNSIFLDSLESDLERVDRINKTIGLIPNKKLEQGGVTLKQVDILSIDPSESIADIATKHAHRLPSTIRFLLRGVGASGGHGATLISYLLFEKEFCRELINLGFKDTMSKKDELMAFLKDDD